MAVATLCKRTLGATWLYIKPFFAALESACAIRLTLEFRCKTDALRAGAAGVGSPRSRWFSRVDRFRFRWRSGPPSKGVDLTHYDKIWPSRLSNFGSAPGSVVTTEELASVTFGSRGHACRRRRLCSVEIGRSAGATGPKSTWPRRRVEEGRNMVPPARSSVPWGY